MCPPWCRLRGCEAQQRIRLGDPVILSRTGTRIRTLDQDWDPGTGDRTRLILCCASTVREGCV